MVFYSSVQFQPGSLTTLTIEIPDGRGRSDGKAIARERSHPRFKSTDKYGNGETLLLWTEPFSRRTPLSYVAENGCDARSQEAARAMQNAAYSYSGYWQTWQSPDHAVRQALGSI